MKRGVMNAVFGIFFILLIASVSAESDYCINPVVTDISPSSVGINEEFTIGILLDNCGNLAPKTITFELKDISSDIYVKEPLMRNITDVGYVSDRFISYHMKTSDDITPGDYYLNYITQYSGEGDTTFIKRGNILITIIGDKAELSIASVKTDPVLPKEKDIVELTLRIENTGEGTAKSVEVYVDHPFQGSKQSFIGALDLDEDGPAVLTFVADEVGEFEFPVIISYKDDFGNNEIKTNISFNVLERESNIGAILLVILIISIFGAGIYYFIKTKKSKNKIIHQLLGDGRTEYIKNSKIRIESYSEKKRKKRKKKKVQKKK